ncbi:hypothetical protein GCM10010112_33410 [Actinoplanes lobatus]|uniref:Uncharacterized protein n=1 Tax=Actinoplanes lobatus TaxID=113568 RepID=A0ABQ4AMH1_9ACTN|nr:hypothetical protein GCM10010112_33410 [Actinoplanes lobatus]GIE42205.1 hypothetical protein Alo02nite_51030 [Actinoplanes lobatus]
MDPGRKLTTIEATRRSGRPHPPSGPPGLTTIAAALRFGRSAVTVHLSIAATPPSPVRSRTSTLSVTATAAPPIAVDSCRGKAGSSVRAWPVWFGSPAYRVSVWRGISGRRGARGGRCAAGRPTR